MHQTNRATPSSWLDYTIWSSHYGKHHCIYGNRRQQERSSAEKPSGDQRVLGTSHLIRIRVCTFHGRVDHWCTQLCLLCAGFDRDTGRAKHYVHLEHLPLRQHGDLSLWTARRAQRLDRVTQRELLITPAREHKTLGRQPGLFITYKCTWLFNNCIIEKDYENS